MLKLVIGVALTLLSWDIKIGAGSIGILPDFIGFFLILLWGRDVEKEGQYYERIQLPAYVMMFYSLGYYALKAFGMITKINDWNRFVVYMIDLAETIGALFVCYLVVFALSHYEHKRRWQVGCKRLQKFFKIMVFGFILYYVSYITVIVMQNYPTVIISLFFNALKGVGVVIFLFFLYKVWIGMEEKL